MGPEGTASLARVLSQTQIQTLKCAASDCAIWPATMLVFHPLPLACYPHLLAFCGASERRLRQMRSLYDNDLGPEGTAALANVLSQTQIQSLKWAAAGRCA